MSAPVVVCRPTEIVQAPARERDVDLTCTPVVNAIEALQVGQTLRTLARDKRTPAGLRPLMDRVGGELAAAARLALTAKGGGQ